MKSSASLSASAVVVSYCLGIVYLGTCANGFVIPNTKYTTAKPTKTNTVSNGVLTSTADANNGQDSSKPRKLLNLQWKSPEDSSVEEWFNSYGEQSRRYRRDVFSPDDWVRVRRPTRFVEQLRSTFRSGLLRQISYQVNLLAAITAFVVFYNNLVTARAGAAVTLGKLAFTLPSLTVSMVPFNLAAASLGLLMTFRTNVSYQRWNEARTAWGRVINDSRSLARMGCVWFKSYAAGTESNMASKSGNAYGPTFGSSAKAKVDVANMNNAMLKRFGDAVCTFSRTIMNRTLPKQEDENAFREYCNTRITNQVYATALIHAQHRPTMALAEISSILVDMQLHPLHQVEIEKMVTELCGSMGACERILSSPVPTFYPRHTVRFLAMWLFGLPFGLYKQVAGWNHYALVPMMMVLGSFLLGIEELSTQMEEPFSILPMEKMCENSIRVPVMEQVKRSIAGLQSKFYGYGKDYGATGGTADGTTGMTAAASSAAFSSYSSGAVETTNPAATVPAQASVDGVQQAETVSGNVYSSSFNGGNVGNTPTSNAEAAAAANKLESDVSRV